MLYRVRCLLLATLIATLPVAPASAGEMLGMYLGGAIGEAQANIDSLSFSAHDTGWKAVFGVRLVQVFGAEAEYVDMGSPTGRLSFGDVHTTANGPAVFGVAYLPLPVPFFDVFAKAGLANVQQQATVRLTPGVGTCALGIACDGFSRSESEFAWGAGAQVKSGSLAVRAEYEQFRAPGGNLNFASVGFYWNFL